MRVATPIRRFALALAFLTRLPVAPAQASEVDVGRSLAFFPLVGLLLGLALAALAALAGVRLPAPVVAVGLVALLALLTGGLHLDGVADVFDALGAPGADRERRLEILRDSRIGAHGATALGFVLLGKVAALQAVVEAGDPSLLVVFPAVARWAAGLVLLGFPYARPEGLGSPFWAHGRASDAAWASVVVLAAVVWLGGNAWLAALATLALLAGFATLATRRFGGITGDVCGAVIELGEVAFLVLALVAA